VIGIVGIATVEKEDGGGGEAEERVLESEVSEGA
jgi:hypothetical protein